MRVPEQIGLESIVMRIDFMHINVNLSICVLTYFEGVCFSHHGRNLHDSSDDRLI